MVNWYDRGMSMMDWNGLTIIAVSFSEIHNCYLSYVHGFRISQERCDYAINCTSIVSPDLTGSWPKDNFFGCTVKRFPRSWRKSVQSFRSGNYGKLYHLQWYRVDCTCDFANAPNCNSFVCKNIFWQLKKNSFTVNDQCANWIAGRTRRTNSINFNAVLL